MTTTSPDTLPGGARNRFVAQRVAERTLAPHPFRLELRGSPNAIAWPSICAYCGATASERIVVRKAFRRPRHGRHSSSRLIDFSIAAAPVPFCHGCASEHRATVRRPSTLGVLLGFLFHPIVIPIVGAAFFGTIAFKSARGLTLADPAGRVGWGLVALMMFIVVWTTVLWWRMTRPSRLEPQTEITRACDFSADVSQAFERQRRIYALRNEAFAKAFEAANLDRRWTEEDQARSRWLSPLLAVAFLVTLAAIAAAVSWLRP